MPRRKFPLSGKRILDIAVVVYIGAVIPAIAVLLPAVRLGAGSAAPVSASMERLHKADSEPKTTRNRQQQAEAVQRRFDRCVAEKSAEIAARLEAQGEITNRDLILFSTPLAETENVTPFGRREVLNFRQKQGIEQMCNDLSPHGD